MRNLHPQARRRAARAASDRWSSWAAPPRLAQAQSQAASALMRAGRPEEALNCALESLQLLGAHQLQLQRWGRDAESVIARSEGRTRRRIAGEDPARLFGGEEGEAIRPGSSEEAQRDGRLLLAAGLASATGGGGGGVTSGTGAQDVALAAALRRRVLDASVRQHAVSRRADLKAARHGRGKGNESDGSPGV